MVPSSSITSTTEPSPSSCRDLVTTTLSIFQYCRLTPCVFPTDVCTEPQTTPPAKTFPASTVDCTVTIAVEPPCPTCATCTTPGCQSIETTTTTEIHACTLNLCIRPTGVCTEPQVTPTPVTITGPTVDCTATITVEPQCPPCPTCTSTVSPLPTLGK